MKAIILAIILTESSFNPLAYNKEGDASGLMQLTPIGVKEAVAQCGLDPNPNLFDPEINVKYGTCLFNFYRGISHSEAEALLLYHGGFLARERFRQGKNPGKKTSRYVIKVLDLQERIINEEFNITIYCNNYPTLIGALCNRKKRQESSSFRFE